MERNVWDKAQAWQWYRAQPWLVGCNYIPSNAINQLEMWQSETYDPETIEYELGWAASLGLNTVRVYLHDLLWDNSPDGFCVRIDQVLGIAQRHAIRPILVLFDDCWNAEFALGKQPKPRAGVHNSGWVQSPGINVVNHSLQWNRLERYVKGVLAAFKQDTRVLMWDLYNEPANNHFVNDIFPLLKKVVSWVREIEPSQPITIGVWKNTPEFTRLNLFQLLNSDVITFHNYSDYESMKKDIHKFKSFNRPVICTEYIARGNKSIFETHMPMMKEHKVGAINWGLVFGKTQTVYPWNSPLDAPVPEIWHHDIFWPDGKPYREEEVKLIRELTGVSQ